MRKDIGLNLLLVSKNIIFHKHVSQTNHRHDLLLITATQRLVGLLVKASVLRAEDHGFESRLRRDFFRG